MDPTQRFSDRVDFYARTRPGYPPEVVHYIQERTGLAAGATIADIGSGTGLSALPFIDAGFTVYGVEPNEGMRAAAEAFFVDRPAFQSVDGSAEFTTLPGASVDLVLAAQAFHWFDLAEAREEFRRILREDKWSALIWNQRKTDTTPFLSAYEQLLRKHGTDYDKVAASHVDMNRVESYFATFERAGFYNEQRFDVDGLIARAMSSSYLPGLGQPGHEALIEDLKRIFAEHNSANEVIFEYECEVFLGRV